MRRTHSGLRSSAAVSAGCSTWQTTSSFATCALMRLSADAMGHGSAGRPSIARSVVASSVRMATENLARQNNQRAADTHVAWKKAGPLR